MKIKKLIPLMLTVTLASCQGAGVNKQQLCPSATAPLSAQLLSPNSPHVMVVAHRGCWRKAPENSLKAIEDCILAGIDMVEIDVRRAKDGVLVAMHDRTVDRTTSMQGAVADYVSSELTAMQLRQGAGGSSVELTTEQVPTFAQVLSTAKGRIMINVDAKEDVLDQTISQIRAMQMEDQVLMKAVVHPEDMPEVATRVGEGIHFMPILWQRSSDLRLSERIVPYLAYEPVAFEIVYSNSDYLTQGRNALEQANVRIWANTMLAKYSAGLADKEAVDNPAAVWGRLASVGVDMIQTDLPILARQYLDKAGLRCHR